MEVLHMRAQQPLRPSQQIDIVLKRIRVPKLKMRLHARPTRRKVSILSYSSHRALCTHHPIAPKYALPLTSAFAGLTTSSSTHHPPANAT